MEHTKDLIDKYRNLADSSDKMQIDSLSIDFFTSGNKDIYDEYILLSLKFSICYELDMIVKYGELNKTKISKLISDCTRLFFSQKNMGVIKSGEIGLYNTITKRWYYEMIKCKNCGGGNNVKNGIKRNKQRYKCRDCGYVFVVGHAHYSAGKLALKALVVMLYSMGSVSYSMLAKIFGVSNGTIHNWVVEAAKAMPEPVIPDDIKEIEFDEMWHYIGKKKDNSGL